MGTLFNQLPRVEQLKYDEIISLGTTIDDIAGEFDISFKDAIDLYMAAAKMNNYDVCDEQLAGFGELLKDLAESYIEAYREANGI